MNETKAEHADQRRTVVCDRRASAAPSGAAAPRYTADPTQGVPGGGDRDLADTEGDRTRSDELAAARRRSLQAVADVVSDRAGRKRSRALVTIFSMVAALLVVNARTASGQATVTINWTDTRQTIDGFGTAQGGDYSDRIHDSPHRTQIMDLAFSNATGGIGLTIFRAEVMTSMQPSPGEFNDTPSCSPTCPLDAKQAWIMREAHNRGAKVIGSVWTPPAWMKDNDNEVGGTLLDSRRQDFANHLRHFATTYAAANGFTVYGVSVANEPNATVEWRSCSWTGSQMATFLASHLAPAFSGISTKVIAPETSSWDIVDSFLGPTYNNSTARNRLDIAAGHLYSSNPALYLATSKSHQKKVWQTEASLVHPVWNIDGALAWAKTIHDSLTGAEVNAWIWWVLGLEGAATHNNDQALISIDGSNPPTLSKTFWILGNFSRFIRPGFVRMTTGTSPGGVFVSAYRDPSSDQFVIVAVNHNFSNVSMNFNVQSFWTHEVTPYVTSASQDLAPMPVTYLQNTQTLPARSVVTFVSRTRNFNLWANAPNARAISGDFNGDGRADIALAGGDGWTSVPVALSLGNGRFTVVNHPRLDFALWANAPGAQVVAGDLNRDGRDDLVVTGGPWTTVPVAFSNGDGSFYTTNLANAYIPGWAQAQGVKILAGDINNDGRDDLILTGGAGWFTIPVGFSNGDGTFNVTNYSVSSFPTWAQDPYAKASVTDVNADGRADIVLTSGAGWSTVPIAQSNGNGTFTVINQGVSDLPVWSQAPGAKTIAGCRRTVPLWDHPEWHHCNFNGGVGGDQRGDIALTGGAGWFTIPVGFGNGNGTFTVANQPHSEFPTWSQDPNVKVVSGDFDGGGRADIALVGGNQWWTVPLAFSFGNGWFSITNYPID